MPAESTRLYGARSGSRRRVLVANFVQSLDGVVAIPGLPRSHALLGDDSEPDRFVIALLRACADVGCWSAPARSPRRRRGRGASTRRTPAAEVFATAGARGLPEQPRVAVVTSGVSFVPSHPVLDAGAIVLTTETRAPGIAEAVPDAAEVVAVNDGASVDLRLPSMPYASGAHGDRL